ncbi:hypothetical protein BKA81DRAFT_233258 [Phyllosticta paracitricarpa]
MILTAKRKRIGKRNELKRMEKTFLSRAIIPTVGTEMLPKMGAHVCLSHVVRGPCLRWHRRILVTNGFLVNGQTMSTCDPTCAVARRETIDNRSADLASSCLVHAIGSCQLVCHYLMPILGESCRGKLEVLALKEWSSRRHCCENIVMSRPTVALEMMAMDAR